MQSDRGQRFSLAPERNRLHEGASTRRKSMGIQRATFLIDAEGKIAKIRPKVKVPGHVEEVLETLKSL